jgi:hypothetical protein
LFNQLKANAENHVLLRISDAGNSMGFCVQPSNYKILQEVGLGFLHIHWLGLNSNKLRENKMWSGLVDIVLYIEQTNSD